MVFFGGRGFVVPTNVHLWSVDLWSCYLVTLPVLKGASRLDLYDLSFVGTLWLYFVFRGVYSLVFLAERSALRDF